MHHRNRHVAQVSQPVGQLLGVAGVVDDQIDAAFAYGGQDRRFLGFKVQLVLTARRRGHERQTQPEWAELWLALCRAQAAHHAKPGQLILGQEPAIWRGQQLKRGPQQRPRRIRRFWRPLDLEDQRPGGPLQQGSQLPLVPVQPAE